MSKDGAASSLVTGRLSDNGGTLRLRKLRIENHARVQDVRLDVRGHLVLVGANDVGKSSLLRCLDLTLGASTAQLYARLSAADFRDVTQDFVVEADLVDLTDIEKAHFPDESRADPDTDVLTLTIRLEVTLENEETIQIRRFAPHGSTNRQVTRDQLAALGWKMVGANQGGVRDFRDEKNAALDDILAAIDFGEERGAFQGITDQYQAQLDHSDVLHELRDQLAGQLSKAVPSPVQAEDLSFVAGSVADDDLLADVRLQFIRNGVPRNMSEQSDGARALFAIALYDLVSSAANVVAIDEPEIHLHPASQRSLARLLKSGNNQKIVATHSPEMVGAFDPNDIVVVKAGGHIVQPHAGFLDHETRLAAQWWISDKLEPLTATHVVIVEGPSDRLVLRRVADLLGYDLDRLGVSVVSLDGAGDVRMARAIFGPSGFRVPMSTLIDDDRAVRNVERAYGIQRADFTANHIYVSTPDLEGEYVTALGAGRLWESFSASTEFSKNKLKTCVPTGADGTYTIEDVARFCRSDKIRAALVVVDVLAETEAETIVSLVALLEGLDSES
jgi:putative ATP-dependent endonuclease of OLD family